MSITSKQIRSLIDLIITLKKRFDISEVLGHYEVDPKKTCPNIKMALIRELIDKIGV